AIVQKALQHLAALGRGGKAQNDIQQRHRVRGALCTGGVRRISRRQQAQGVPFRNGNSRHATASVVVVLFSIVTSTLPVSRSCINPCFCCFNFESSSCNENMRASEALILAAIFLCSSSSIGHAIFIFLKYGNPIVRMV